MFSYNIFLIGFMGSGKTTVSDFMRKTYAIEAVEMDSLIAEREGMSIADIFAAKGEEYFRALETDLLKELQGKGGAVISCGGGVPMRECNVSIMKENGKVVLLTAAPETIYERTKDSHSRPLLENNKNVPYIAELMEKRREKYEAAADLIIATDGKNIVEICTEIMEKLHEAEGKE